ncbi:NADH dehydrogenase (ubiquinone) 1 alpha subcomplex assembly factor 3 [Gammaproteobacteria bacterium]
MKFVLDVPVATYVIQSHGSGQVVINNQRYAHSLVVMPELLITDWPPKNFADLTTTHLENLAQYPLDVILLGTGERLRFPSRALISPLEKKGIGVEIMSTGAACRTYNLLITERRQVAALLLMD